eukprot:753246-Hanusia_phi.AAC.1
MCIIEIKPQNLPQDKFPRTCSIAKPGRDCKGVLIGPSGAPSRKLGGGVDQQVEAHGVVQLVLGTLGRKESCWPENFKVATGNTTLPCPTLPYPTLPYPTHDSDHCPILTPGTRCVLPKCFIYSCKTRMVPIVARKGSKISKILAGKVLYNSYFCY